MAKTKKNNEEGQTVTNSAAISSPAESQTNDVAPETVMKLTPIQKKVMELMKDRPVFVNSVASGILGLGQGSILREMQKARCEMLRFYLKPEGGSLPIEEAIKTVDGPDDDDYTEQLIANLLSESVEMVSWYSLERLHARAPKVAKKIWELVKEEARKEFESGHRAAEVFEPVHWLRDTWRRAKYLGLRESFIDQWKPQGGIELALIDQLTQSFYLYLYWNEVSVTRTETEVRADPPLWVVERAARDHSFPRQRGHGWWDPPYARDVEAVEHAAQMADRYLRAFHRTLRAMRDMRRYSTPVTINNPQQVNIAADGGQQVNVAEAERQTDTR
ncbi:MAG: hypothetical protein HONDAALG_00735 [Gammaproteobacteria bacterium]|nr:hypothetical protein [Gammaproteobacteria bacterium]